MFQKKRPVSGPFVLLAAAIALALSAVACSPKPATTEDSWRLTPPTLEISDVAGSGAKTRLINVSKLNAAFDSAVANDTSVLRFASADQGVGLKVRSQCEDGFDKTPEYQTSLIIDESVSILAMLPPTALRPEALKKNWTCRLQMRAVNSVGSMHAFSIEGLKVSMANVYGRFVSLQRRDLVEDSGIRAETKRRLVCSTWWTDFAPETDLTTAARVEKVEGHDDRESNRQPVCSVLELSKTPRISRFFQPRFGSAAISWSMDSLVFGSQIANAMMRPLLRWTLQNDGGVAQIVFVPNPPDVRIAAYSTSTHGRHAWGPALRANAFFSAEGSENKRSATGLYVKIPARGTAQITLQSNRSGIACNFNQAETSAFLISVRQPQRFRVLANVDLAADFSATNPEALDRVSRDPVTEDEPAPFSDVVLQSAGRDVWTASDTTVDQARATGVENISFCVAGNRVDMSDLTAIHWLTE